MNPKFKLLYPAILLFVFVPTTLFAASSYPVLTKTTGIVQGIGGVIRLLIPVVAGLALLYFFWGLAKFILHSDNEEAIKEGKKVMMWGIVALFVLVSIWGIIRYMRTEVGVDYVDQSWVPGFGTNEPPEPPYRPPPYGPQP